MSLITIEKRICLDNSYLDANYQEHLLLKVQDDTIGECTAEHGHVIHVNRLLDIKDNYISNVNCDTIFTVVFEALTLNPLVGSIWEGNVCMIFVGGLFLSVLDKQKVLIPVKELYQYEFAASDKCFKLKDVVTTTDINGNRNKSSVKGTKIANKSNLPFELHEGDVLNVKIIGSKYAKGTYRCFGTPLFKD